VLELANKQRRPVLFHSGETIGIPDFRFTPPNMIVRIAEQYPDLPFLIGHMGLSQWREVTNMAAPYPNLYLDITMSMPYPERLRIAVETVGPQRVLYGTDMPLLSPAISLGLVKGAMLSKDDEEKILGGNINQLLNAIVGI